MSDTRRVLVVVGAMNRGGIETWLMNIARHLDPSVVELTFLKHQHAASDYDDEIVRLGHRIVVCASPRRPHRYVAILYRILREGHFDVVHSFVSNFSAIPLAVAKFAGVPIRIAHSQTDRRSLTASAGLRRRLYLGLSSRLIRWAMTRGIGCTDEASLYLFGRKPSQDPRLELLPNGIDLEPFAHARGGLRSELNLAPGTLLVGHLGRFVPVKNQALLLEVATAWKREGVRAHLAMAGDGPLRKELEDRSRSEGLSGWISFLGLRSDVPELLASFDAFVLPSLYEGSPIALLEAQAAGVPCVVSANVAPASDVVTGLVSRVPTGASAEAWARETVARAVAPHPSRDEAQAQLANSPWSVGRVIARLDELWSADAGGLEVSARCHGGIRG